MTKLQEQWLLKVEDFKDPSLYSLVGANLLTILVSYIQQWPIADVMLVYWGQSVIIGFFQFLKILDLRNFSTEGFLINNQPVLPTEGTKKFTAGFFAVHYGIFHLVYFGFLIKKGPDVFAALTLLLPFLLNHVYSYFKSRPVEMMRRRNIGSVMFAPYGRIFPMHLTIILSNVLGARGLELVLFQVVKMVVDVVSHVAEHKQWERSGQIS